MIDHIPAPPRDTIDIVVTADNLSQLDSFTRAEAKIGDVVRVTVPMPRHNGQRRAA